MCDSVILAEQTLGDDGDLVDEPSPGAEHDPFLHTLYDDSFFFGDSLLNGSLCPPPSEYEDVPIQQGEEQEQKKVEVAVADVPEDQDQANGTGVIDYQISVEDVVVVDELSQVLDCSIVSVLPFEESWIPLGPPPTLMGK